MYISKSNMVEMMSIVEWEKANNTALVRMTNYENKINTMETEGKQLIESLTLFAKD